MINLKHRKHETFSKAEEEAILWKFASCQMAIDDVKSIQMKLRVGLAGAGWKQARNGEESASCSLCPAERLAIRQTGRTVDVVRCR